GRAGPPEPDRDADSQAEEGPRRARPGFPSHGLRRRRRPPSPEPGGPGGLGGFTPMTATVVIIGKVCHRNSRHVLVCGLFRLAGSAERARGTGKRDWPGTGGKAGRREKASGATSRDPLPPTEERNHARSPFVVADRRARRAGRPGG